jgi:hypothetical protein
MICPVCEGKGILPSTDQGPIENWDGSERRQEERSTAASEHRFVEVIPAARYTVCPTCEGGGKVYANLLSLQKA